MSEKPSLYQDIKHDGFFHGVSHWAKDTFTHHNAPHAETNEAAPPTAAEAAVHQAAALAPTTSLPASPVRLEERAVPMPAQAEHSLRGAEHYYEVSRNDRPHIMAQPGEAYPMIQPQPVEAAEPLYEKPSLMQDIKHDGLIGGTMDWVKDHLPGHKHKPPAAYHLEEKHADAGKPAQSTISVEGLKTELPATAAATKGAKPVELAYEKPSLKEDIKHDGLITGTMDWVKDHLPGHSKQPPAMYDHSSKEEASVAATREQHITAAQIDQTVKVTYEKPSLREDIKHDGVVGGAMDWVKDHLPGHKDKLPAMYDHPAKEVEAPAPKVSYEKPSWSEDVKHDGLITGTMDSVKDHMPGHKEKPPSMLEHHAEKTRALEPTYEKPSLKEDIRHDGLLGGAVDWVKDHLPGHQHQPPAMYQHETKEQKPVAPTYEKPSLKEDIKADGVLGGAVDWVKDHLPGHKHQPPAMFQHHHNGVPGVRDLTPTGVRSNGGSLRSTFEFNAHALPSYATPSRAYQQHMVPGTVRAYSFGAATSSNVNLLAAGRLVGERRVSKDELVSKGNLVEEQGIPRTYVAQWDSVKRCFEPPPQVSAHMQGPFMQAPPAFQRPTTPVRTVTPIQRFPTPSAQSGPAVVVADPMISTTKTILPQSHMQPATPPLSATHIQPPPPSVTLEPFLAAHPLHRQVSLSSRPVTPLGTLAFSGPARTPLRSVTPVSLSAAAPAGLPAAPAAASVRFPFAAVPRVSVARPPSRPMMR